MNVNNVIEEIRKDLNLIQLKQQFENPDATYRPQPFWFLNHELEKPELKSQIQSMFEAGVGGVVLHARHGMQTPYLSPEFIEVLEFCTTECKKRNMVVWLYDEDNWPSGTLGGKLTRQHPEYRMRYLRVEEKRHSRTAQQEALRLDFASYDNNELIAILAYRAVQQDGEWLLYDSPEDITHLWGRDWKPDTEDTYIVLACWSCEIAEGITFAQGYYLDTLNPEAVQTFIQMSYEPFLPLQTYFGSTIQGVFTDEPGLMIHDGFFGVEAIRTTLHDVGATLPGMVFAWTHGMAQRYQHENGYDLIPRLGALLYNMADGSRSTKQQYYDTITRWYVEGYHHAIRSWCERHGLLYIGHTLEEPVWGQARSQGNQTRVLQQFHYAGVDYLTPGIGTKENPHRIVSVKTAASVAQLDRKKRVICESFGASGHGYSMRQRRLDANFMAFLGVNLFIPHAFYYSFAGVRKTDFPPTEFKHAPHWPHYKAFADYIGRLSLLGASGKRTPEVLLLSPIHTVYQNMFASGESNRHPSSDVLFSLLSDRMLRGSIDYDYVDECQLRDATLVDGEGYRFGGDGNVYSILIMPEIEVMSRDIAEQLVSFVKQGGTLIAVGAIPQYSETMRKDPELLKYINELFSSDRQHGELHAVGKGYSLFYSMNDAAHEGDQAGDRLEAFCAQLSDLLREPPAILWNLIKGQSEDLIRVERKIGDFVYVWIMNWSEQSVTIKLDPRENKDYLEEWDLENGGVRRLDSEAVLTFVPGELRVLSVSPHEQPSFPQEHTNNGDRTSTDVVVLGEKWQFKTVDPNVLLLDQWHVTLNDRQSKMNAIMPGQVNTYRTTFRMTQELIEIVQSQSDSGHSDASGKEQSAKIELILDDVEQKIPSHIGFLSRRRNLEIFVNGIRQEALKQSSWQDAYYDSVDITPHLLVGENELEILTVSLLELMPAISFPAFLIGPFAIEDHTTLNADVEHLDGFWNTAGYPYYSGTGSYSQYVDLTHVSLAPNDELWLEADEIRETACLYVNDMEAGIRLWPPYRWDITPYLQEGNNKINIHAANTLENLYGKSALPSGINGQMRLVRRTLL
ncbi:MULTISPECIES: glycosylhydrolase-like jelly roll fold domain-containing protein [Paenibacillus]|uniref:Beta-galactosidase n=1 Tax=Paenibacillus lautus TaxID=1401 RepID=A0A1R1AY78_PAELA|nr:glycosyl hydrolase [Paenibacillus lautus]OME90798.1 beta-galactosidase [Paenibacillus lautus]